MRIQAIYINAFAGLKDYSLRFPPGAVVFYGLNERGKSTVLHFLRAMFYGLGDRRGSDNLRERFTPWDNTPMGGHVWFNLDGTNYELKRSFGERKSLDQLSLTDLDRNRLVEVADPEQPGAELFGLEQEVFNNSVFVEATGPGLEKSEESRRALWENLADFMISPDDKITAAELLDKLDKAKRSLRSPSGRSGELPALEQEEAELEAERAQLEKLYQKEMDLASDLDYWLETIRRLNAEEEKLQLEMDFYRLRENEAKLRLAQAPAEQLAGLEAEAKQLEGALAPFGKTPAEQEAALDAAEAELASAAQKQAEAEAAAAECRERELRYKKIFRVIGEAGIFLAVLFFLSAFFYNKALIPLGAVTAAAALICILRGAIGGRFLKDSRTAEAAKARAAAEAEAALEKKFAALAYKKEEWESEGAQDPRQRFLQSRRSIAEDRRSLSREIGRLRELSAAQAESLGGTEDLEAGLTALRAELEAKAGAAAYKELAAGNGSREACRAKLEEVREQLRSAERHAGETQAGLEALLRDPLDGRPLSPAEAISKNGHRLDALREEIALKEKRYRALGLAREHLEENLKDLRQGLLPELAERAGFYLEKMSRGRYDQLIVNDKLDLLLRSQDGYYHAPERFSSGTEDQLYFAFRLALSDYLSSGRSMPLLLDDALVNFDDKRAKEALWLLAERGAGFSPAKAQGESGTAEAEAAGEAAGEAAEKSQVLLFTCHKRLVKLAKEASWQIKNLPRSN